MKQVWTNIEGNRANLVQTAWALLSLIDAGQVGSSFSLQLFALHYNIALLQSTKEYNALEKEQISLKKSSCARARTHTHTHTHTHIYIYKRTHMLILSVSTNLGRDRSNTNSPWGKSIDQFPVGRW
jgi:hypothetical protein